MKFIGLAAALACLVAAACAPKQTPQEASATSESAVSETAAISMAASQVASETINGTFDAPAFMGKWTGVKGATLEIVPNGTGYTLTLTDGAGSHDYPANVGDGTLSFDRDGSTYTLTRGDGTATGEPELRGKHNCLIVAAGEGYCK